MSNICSNTVRWWRGGSASPPDSAGFPTAESIHVPNTTPREEADVPAIASLTSPIGPRYDSLGHWYLDNNEQCPPSARVLFEQARQALIDAEYATHPIERYVQAHLAALRGAAAVLAARARPRRRAAPTSAWKLLSTVAPELAEWAAFFAAASMTRAAAEAGVHRLMTHRDAHDMVRPSRQFLTLAWRAAARAFP